MDFVDATLTKLATPATRDALFDQAALGQLVATAYDADALAVEGPYQPVFDELRLGPSLPPMATIEGGWQNQDGSMRHDLHLRLGGVAGESVGRVDALWRGSILARASPLDSTIEEAQVTWSRAGEIDAEIIAADGSLPANPNTRESKRRARFAAHLKAGMADPDALTDERIDALLASVGAISVGDAIEHLADTAQAGAVSVAFSAPSQRAPAPLELPMTVAILIRDEDGLSLAALLAESHALCDRLDTMAVHQAATPTLPVRTAIVVAWLVPQTLFDDTDWPGAQPAMSASAARDARRAAAGAWLAAEGIGLATLT
jgi:hypothetical protein